MGLQDSSKNERPFHAGDFHSVVGRFIPQEIAEYVVPDLQHDLNRGIYLTAELARTHTNPLVRAIYKSLQRYFEALQQIAKLAIAGDRQAMQEFERRLSFPERAELRFGFVRRGHRGAASGDGVIGAFLRDVLIEYPALLQLLSNVPDGLQMTPRFDMDRISDAFGTIALREIVLLTQDYARRDGFHASCMRECVWKNVWNQHTLSFDRELRAVVPVDSNGNPILLIDKLIVRGTRAIDSRDYLDSLIIDGKRVKQSLSKKGLLDRLARHPEKLESFAQARLVGIRPHSAFQGEENRGRRKRT